MAKKVSFDNLPAAVEKVLEILTASGSDHTALPEIIQRVKLLEKRFDNLERLLSPDRLTMDKQTVSRVLKLRPKALSDLELSGALISHKDGRSSVYYEDDVIRFFMNNGWKTMVEAASKPEAVEPAAEESELNITAPDNPANEIMGRIDIAVACEIVERNAGAIYQLIKTGTIPSYKDGRKVYFVAEELREWIKTHPARKYKRKKQ